MNGGSQSMPVWEKWGTLGNLLGCQTLMTLLPKRFWSVKTQTNQTSDKCLQSGLSVFTPQQLALKTNQPWLKMNWMQPALVLHAAGRSDSQSPPAHRHQGWVGDRFTSAAAPIFKGQHAHIQYDMVSLGKCKLPNHYSISNFKVELANTKAEAEARF